MQLYYRWYPLSPDHVGIQGHKSLSEVLEACSCQVTVLRKGEEMYPRQCVVDPLEPQDGIRGGVSVEPIYLTAAAQVVESLEEELWRVQ